MDLFFLKSHYVFKIPMMYVKYKEIFLQIIYTYIPYLVKILFLFSKGTTCIILLLSFTKRHFSMLSATEEVTQNSPVLICEQGIKIYVTVISPWLYLKSLRQHDIGEQL